MLTPIAIGYGPTPTNKEDHTTITICSPLSGMEDYHCWKANLTGALLVGNIYNICYRQNKAHLPPAAPTSTSRLVERGDQTVQEDIPPSERQVLSYEQQLETWNSNVSKVMGIILGSLSQGMCQHILSLGYRTPWETIEGIDKLILKSDQSQDYTDLTYLISSKMGADENVTDYFARRLPIFDRLELSLRNSEGRFPEKWKSIFTLIGLAPSFESTGRSTYHGGD